MARVSRPVLYGGIAALALIAWIATAPPETRESTSLGELRRGPNGGKTQVKVVFTEADRNAFENPYPRLNEAPRNAFNPLVARRESGGVLAPNEFPASYTGGEAGWFYTGTVVVNDVPSALVENELTGEGMYLRVGDALKRAVIAQITPTYIVVRGAGGQSLRLNLLSDPEEDDGGVTVRDLAVEPVRPNVPGAPSGPIRTDGFLELEEPRDSEQ